MKTLRNSITISILSLFLFIAGFQPPQDIPEAISAAFKAGNSKELVKHFNSNVELVILENEDVYSKTQAEMILRDFFEKQPPKNFAILHQGGKNGSKYAIGDLTTSKGNFRVYFLLKKREDSYLIHQLRIEKEN
jgi:hypothetical protein